MDDYDPTEHWLPADVRTCQCPDCHNHGPFNREDRSVCGVIFRLSKEGTQCMRCAQYYCARCSLKCGLCDGGMCRKCDGCDTCESVVCSSCTDRHFCGLCHRMCCIDFPRCEFDWKVCDFCNFVVCKDCDRHRKRIFFSCRVDECDKTCCGDCLSRKTVFPCKDCRYWYCADCRRMHNQEPCDEEE